MLNRREAIQGAAAAAVTTAVAGFAAAQDAPGPFSGATAKFDQAKLDRLPNWVFTRPLETPLTLRPKFVGGFAAVHDQAVFAPADPVKVGRVFHGIAREWAETPEAWKDAFGCDPAKTGAAAWADKQARFGRVERYKVKPPVPGQEVPEREADGAHANWGGFPVKCYKMPIVEGSRTLRPDAAFPARVYAYAGEVPGPTLRMRIGQPVVVRQENHLETEVSTHLHGGHSPSHSDGFPSFYVLQGKSRDYFYPNILPLERKGDALAPDRPEAQSTLWYHDHGMDATGYNVSKGLAAMALCFGEDELFLIRAGVLPGLRDKSCLDPDEQRLGDPAVLEDPAKPGFYKRGQEPFYNPYDVPLVLQDKVIDPATGQIAYDADAHNGYLGDTMFVNGVAWPVMTAENRKYRFRVLNGSNARVYRLRLLSEEDYLRSQAGGLSDAEMEKAACKFLRIGKDSWLWPEPLERKSMVVAMANRADIVVDFGTLTGPSPGPGAVGDGKGTRVFYLVNTMPQTDGRGPKAVLEDGGDPRILPLPFAVPGEASLVELNRPVALMKIVVEGDRVPAAQDASVRLGMPLMPARERIKDEEIRTVREFIFERGKGAWQVNGRFYDPAIANACPTLDSAEEWVFRNGGGGWWHPIHVHLEAHQVVRYEKDFDADRLPAPAEPAGTSRLANLRDVTRFHDEFVPSKGFVIGNHDTQVLGPNTVVRVRMRFRTWTGPFVFHCHNLEHEDMRMMFNFEPVPKRSPGSAKDHDPDVVPDARTHGNTMTWNAKTPANESGAVGELAWEYPPVPATTAEDAGRKLIEERKKP